MTHSTVSAQTRFSAKLVHWASLHAVIILLTGVTSLFTGKIWPGIFGGIASFAWLIRLAKNRWTDTDRFGIANSFTLFRLSTLLILAFFSAELNDRIIALVGILILIGDGIDGYLARRFRETSEFGEFFDKETDAFFLLLLCLMAVFKQQIGNWVVLLGFLRYLFAIFLLIYKTDIKKEQRSQFGRIIYVIVVSSLISTFLPIPQLYRPAIFISAILLFYSFGKDVVWIVSGK